MSAGVKSLTRRTACAFQLVFDVVGSSVRRSLCDVTIGRRLGGFLHHDRWTQAGGQSLRAWLPRAPQPLGLILPAKPGLFTPCIRVCTVMPLPFSACVAGGCPRGHVDGAQLLLGASLCLCPHLPTGQAPLDPQTASGRMATPRLAPNSGPTGHLLATAREAC